MSRTTDEWEALLDGITPHPWRFDNGWSVSGIEVDDWDMDEYARPNLRLTAAAPDAVSELVYLRKRLKGLADWHDMKAVRTRACPTPGREAEGERVARIHETARDKIIHILEADNE